VRKIQVIASALAGLFLTSACAAGQIAATAEVQATLDGVNRTLGPIGLHGLSLGAPTEGPSYPAGSNIPINMVLVNSGNKPDKLVGITSSLAKSWSSYSKADANLVLNAPGARHAPGAQSVTIPPGSQIASGAVYGKQLVLLGTSRRIWPGNTVTVVFQFQNAGTIRVPVPVHLTEGERTGLTVPSETSPSPVGN
jgi:periplasmic copper chaperone A